MHLSWASYVLPEEEFYILLMLKDSFFVLSEPEITTRLESKFRVPEFSVDQIFRQVFT